jgi:transcriptional regulator with XRE-family HTH domain
MHQRSLDETAMNTETWITGRLIAAARALTGISAKDLATTSGVSIETLRQIEASGSAWLQPGAELDAVKRALETFGAIFIPESGGFGAGVRLKFLRQDVRQIGRLETEGGIVADDDVP